MEEITITVPKVLAEHFIELAKRASDKMGNAGCNDFIIDDTPDNRELIELCEANNLRMTLEEYRASDDYQQEEESYNGKLCTFDFGIFELFVNQVKKAIE